MWLVVNDETKAISGLYDMAHDAAVAVAQQDQPSAWRVVECTPRLFFALQQNGATITWTAADDGRMDVEDQNA